MSTKDGNQDDFDGHFADFNKSDGGTVVVPKEPPAPPAPPADPAPSATPPAPPAPAPSPAEEVVTREEYERRLAEMAHRERSSANRVSAFARQNAELQSQLNELKAKIQAPPPAAAPAEPPPKDEPDVLDGAEDLAAAVERRVNRVAEKLTKRIDEVVGKTANAEALATRAVQHVEPLVSERHEKSITNVKQELSEKFGGWDELMPSQAFQDWVAAQPAPIQLLYRDGQTFAETSKVLRLYAAETGHQFKAAEAPAPAADPKQPQTSEALRMAAGIRPRSAGSNARPDPNDFDGAFAEFSAKKD